MAGSLPEWPSLDSSEKKIPQIMMPCDHLNTLWDSWDLCLALTWARWCFQASWCRVGQVSLCCQVSLYCDFRGLVYLRKSMVSYLTANHFRLFKFMKGLDLECEQSLNKIFWFLYCWDNSWVWLPKIWWVIFILWFGFKGLVNTDNRSYVLCLHPQ